MKRQNKAYLFALLAVFLWSTVASAFKLTLRHVDYLTLLFYSALTSTLFLFVVLLVQGKLGLLGDAFGLRRSGGDRGEQDGGPTFVTRRRGRSTRLRGLARSLAGGFLNPFFYYIVLFKAYSILPAQEAQPLNYTWPVVLALLASPLLGERIRFLSLLGLAVSFFGVAVISTRGHLLELRFASPQGVVLAVGSAVVWAIFWLINIRDERDPSLKLFLNFLFGLLLVFAASFALRHFGLRGGPGVGGIPDVSGTSRIGVVLPRADPLGLLGCVYVGLFEMGLTFVLWFQALRLSETTAKVSNLVYLSPFLSLVFIRFVVGETILLTSILGLGLIIGGVLIQGTIKPLR